jgi:hypothetical protein
VQEAAAIALASLSIDKSIIGEYLEGKLQQYRLIAEKQAFADTSINSLLFALQRIASKV